MELKGHQQQEMEGELPLGSHLTLTERTSAPVEACSLKVPEKGTYHCGPSAWSVGM